MICWYCHWGWSEPVAAIYQQALVALNGNDRPLHFGPSHIVWEDENFEREHIQFCLGECDKNIGNFSEYDIKVVRTSLLALLTLPDEILCPQPADYDGENPEKYPPKIKTVHV